MRTLKTDSFYFVEKDDKFWLDTKGTTHNIENMDVDYLLNVVMLLQNRNVFLEGSGRALYIIPDLMLTKIEEYKITNPEYFL